MDFDKTFRNGGLLVNWLPSLAGGGQPVFEFYPPLSYYFSEIFVLVGLSFVNAVKATIISSFFLSGMTMFVLIRRIANNNNAAFISAITYMILPYHLIDSNLRGDLAETFSFIFLPMILYFLYESMYTNNYILPAISAGISYAFLILSHIIVGYMFSLFTIMYLILNSSMDAKSLKKLFSIIMVFGCTATGLSCIYWLPAILEERYVNFNYFVNLAGGISNNYIYINQLFYPSKWTWGASGPGLQNSMPLSIGIFGTLVFLFSLVIVGKRINPNRNRDIFLIIFIVSALFTTNFGILIIKYLPYIENIQFPWRYLTVSSFSLAVLSGFMVKDIDKFLRCKYLSLFLILLIFGLSYPTMSIPGGYLDKPSTEQDLPYFYRGEYLPKYDSTVFQPLNSTYPNIIYRGDYNLIKRSPTYWRFSTNESRDLACELKIFYFPRWNLLIDGRNQEISVSQMGTISFMVPKGNHTIEVRYIDTITTKISKIISFLTLISMLLILSISHLRKVQNSHRGT